MTFHSLSPNEASAARQISTVQESKVMHYSNTRFILAECPFTLMVSLSYSWLTKVMDHLSYWLFIVYFSSWQIGWQQDPFQLYIYWCSRPNRVVISLMIPPLISSYWLTHLSCQYLMCYTQQLLHTHYSTGPFKPSKINFAKSNFLVYCVVSIESHYFILLCKTPLMGHFLNSNLQSSF